MAISFTRQLGYEPGVQLNPTVDKSEGFAINAVEDQTFGCVLRLPRGPIDRAFMVSKSDVRVLTGMPEPTRKNALNDAHSQLIEALNKGAKCAVVSRLVGSGAKNRWVVISKNKIAGPTQNHLMATLSDELPTTPFLFALKHKGCFTDGIRLSISAKEKRDGSNNLIDNDEVSLKLLDRNQSVILSFNSSLDLNKVDDNELPNNLQSIVSNFNSEELDIVLAANAAIPKESQAYGKDANGLQKTFVTDVLYPFTEGNLTYSANDYKAATQRLSETNLDFVYLSTLGSSSMVLISDLYQLAFNKNIQLAVDIPNNLTPKQAIAWKGQTGITSHLVYFLWHPVECTDPNGVSGRVQFGTGAYRLALSCLRNAAINNMGFSKKNYAIAGRQFPVQRLAMKQLYKPSQDELSDLALAGITPVIYETFSGGGLFIFADAITASGKSTSYLNLINSVEIATSLERDVARMGKESFMFGPMSEAIKIAERMIKQHFENAETSGWLVKSDELDGQAFKFDIRPNVQRPADVMNVKTSMRVEGCVRQVHITNEISR